MDVDQLALFGPVRTPRRAARQTERALAALRRQHGLEPVNVGQVAMLRTLAELVDREATTVDGSAFTVARLVTEWRALWAELTGERSTLDAELRAFFGDDHGDSAPALRDTP